jgi:hypothetical protein
LAQEVTWACRRTTAPKLLPHATLTAEMVSNFDDDTDRFARF